MRLLSCSTGFLNSKLERMKETPDARQKPSRRATPLAREGGITNNPGSKGGKAGRVESKEAHSCAAQLKTP